MAGHEPAATSGAEPLTQLPWSFEAAENASSSVSVGSPSSTGTMQRLSSPAAARYPRGDLDVPAVNRPSAQATGSNAAAAAAAGRAEDNRVDALWAKMQLTLEEVELSALGSTHVFGSAHNTALEELREAQIALARAWGRGEADNEFEAMDAAWADEDEQTSDLGIDKDNDDAKRSQEEDAEIAEARKRRETNERFFTKVQHGVADVVGKLDEVATAMAKVEKESREIWDERDSAEESSLAS